MIVGLRSFGGIDDRLARRDELDRELSAWTRARPAREIMTQLQSVGVPAAAVYSAADVIDDPQLAARRFWQMLERAYVGAAAEPGRALPRRSRAACRSTRRRRRWGSTTVRC